MFQQLKEYIPESEKVIEKAEGAYVQVVSTTVQAYETNLALIQKSQERLMAFRKDATKYAQDISWETINEILRICEIIARVKTDGKDVSEEKDVRQRLQLIVESFKRVYIQQPLEFGRQKSLAAYKSGRKIALEKGLPLYIHLKAVVIVSQQILLEFLTERLSDLKMTYETRKDSVVMFFSGKFNEEILKQKLGEGIEGFKQMTVNIVNKGLEVKIDKESFVKNYDKFAIDFMRTIRDIKEKSQDNIGEVKKKSKDLYEEVMNRIKAKELEIKIEMKALKNSEEQFGSQISK